MPAFICPNCHHTLKADAETLLYLINHPPKCLNCGHESAQDKDIRNKQWIEQLKKRGFRRTARLHDSVYHSGKEKAVEYLKELIEKNQLNISTEARKKVSKLIFWLIMIGSFGPGFIPLFIELLSGPDLYCRDMVYVDDGKTGKIWAAFGVGYDENEARLFAYDPLTGDRISKMELETEAPMTTINLVQKDQVIWMLGNNYGSQPEIYIIDALNGEILMNTEQFLKSTNKLPGELAEIQFLQPDCLTLTGTDGTSTYYSIQYDLYFNTQWDCQKYGDSIRTASTGAFILEHPAEASTHVQKLYLRQVVNTTIDSVIKVGSEADLTKYFTRYQDPIQNTLLTDRSFLDASIVFKTDEMVVIRHLDKLGVSGKKLITGVNKTGKNIFEIYEIDGNPDEDDEEDYAPTATRFDQYGSMFVITYGYEGMCGVNLSSGKIDWTFQLDE